jgi:hypothetical protein
MIKMINANERQPTSDQKRARILKLKRRLPNGYMTKFLERFPQYNTPKGKMQVYSVVTLKSTNLEIIEGLESIAL